jgi:type IV pilus assembly protein PilB
MARQRLGEILMQAGVLRQDQLDLALREQQRWGGQLGHVLVAKAFIDEATLVRALSRQLKIDAVDLAGVKIGKDVLDLVSEEVAVEHMLIPFRRQGTFLDIAMSNPLDLGITDELRIRTRLNVRPHLAGASQIEAAIRAHYGGARNIAPISVGLSVVTEEEASGAARADDDPATVRALQERVAHLEALVARDEDVLRKLFALLIDKGVATREEILAALK